MAADEALLARLGCGTTVAEAQRLMRRYFAEAGLETPGLDARRLIAGACGIAPADVVIDPTRTIAPEATRMLAGYAQRRLAREPVSRILACRAFRGLDLEITPATLDPRPESETLVDGVLRLVADGEAPGGAAPGILDAGTGSGAILLALLHALPAAEGLGIDRSAETLEVATRNAGRSGLAGRAAFLCTSWLAGVSGTFDIIVSNPPYIPQGDICHLQPEVRLHDPATALDGGADGLDAYRALIPMAKVHLCDGGWLALEIGDGQAEAVSRLLAESGFTASPPRIWLDLAGKPRCVAVQHRSD